MTDIANATWSSAEFTMTAAIIYDAEPMPAVIAKKRGKRGRKMRAAWRRGRLYMVVRDQPISTKGRITVRWDSDGIVRLS